MRSRALLPVMATVLLAVALPTGSAAAAPVPDQPGTKRLAGADRYATAAAIVQDSYPTGPVPVAFVATGASYADALAGGPAAGVLGGPVLPVASGGIPAPVRSALTRLRPGRIVVLGGSSAVSSTIARELDGFTTGTVTRLEGANRYATAARVATATLRSPVPQVLVATGAGFADALAGGAAAAKSSSPVLLVSRDSVPAETAAALRQLQPRDIAVLGGTGVVSDAVLAALRGFAVGGAVSRLSGADRYATAARLAQVFWPQTSAVAYLATGRDFPDALAGVPAAGLDSAPLLLTEPGCLPAATKRELDRLRPTTLVVLGGSSTISQAAASRTVCAAKPPVAGAYSAPLRTAVRQLPVAAEQDAGYDRDAQFGIWIDADGDCQNTRHEVLATESLVPPTYSSQRCTVKAGRWRSLYDDRTCTLASQVAVDHLVAVAEAWGSGARGWTQARRVAFYNDLSPHTLNAMDPLLDQAKAGADPARWMPPANRCRYLAAWTAVKHRWRLTVDVLERDALVRHADACPNDPVTVPRA